MPHPSPGDSAAVCSSNFADPDPSLLEPAQLTSFVVRRVKNWLVLGSTPGTMAPSCTDSTRSPVADLNGIPVKFWVNGPVLFAVYCWSSSSTVA
ncbi:hypothetical protein [Herbiconiux sp. UC225_62]|uniref:hypothetical protein n=1 Tax=Herbiconiux sp. UC225_62 TaxID=3350168 RepID=UPI0036D3DB79